MNIWELLRIVGWSASILSGLTGLFLTGFIFPKTSKKARKALGRYAKRTAGRYVRKKKRKAKAAIKRTAKKVVRGHRKRKAKKVKEWQPVGITEERSSIRAHRCGQLTRDGKSCQRLTRHDSCGRH